MCKRKVEATNRFLKTVVEATPTLEDIGYHLEATDPDDIVKLKYIKGTAVITFYADGEVSKSDIDFSVCRILTTFTPAEMLACAEIIKKLIAGVK